MRDFTKNSFASIHIYLNLKKKKTKLKWVDDSRTKKSI